ncbi:MAG: hypothetical protein JWL77_2127 [Chthonomonadaceae bacterium]|nr:hypothetical protein [Chthonomonadaceae bacterium]
MNTIIASTEMIGVLPTGEERRIAIEIGTPYAVSAEEWRCPVALPGLHDNLSDTAGADSLQSMTLALRMAHTLLGYFEAGGGQFLYSDTREAVPLEAYFTSHKA